MLRNFDLVKNDVNLNDQIPHQLSFDVVLFPHLSFLANPLTDWPFINQTAEEKTQIKVKSKEMKRNRNKLNRYLNWKITVTPPQLPPVQKILLYCGAAIHPPPSSYPFPPSTAHTVEAVGNGITNQPLIIAGYLFTFSYFFLIFSSARVSCPTTRRLPGGGAGGGGEVEVRCEDKIEETRMNKMMRWFRSGDERRTWRIISNSRIISVSFGSLILLINGSSLG